MSLRAQTVDGDIEWYMSSIKKLPKLTQPQLQELAVDYYTTGNINSAKKLVESCLRFVVWTAKKYTYYGVSLNDLIQEGNIGVMYAVKNYNPYAGVSLVSFAVYQVRHYIMDYVMKNKYLFKLGTSKMKRKLFYLMHDSNPEAKISQIAEQYNVDPSVVRADLAAMKTIQMVTDQPDSNAGDGFDESYIATIPANSDLTEAWIELEAQEKLAIKLRTEIAKLDQRWQDILAARYCEEPVSLADLGEKYGISFQRVQQIERKAIKRLSEKMI
jgi:RNA polymerase sigma-32 factor